MPVLRSITAVWIATVLRVGMAVTVGSVFASLADGRGVDPWQVLLLVVIPLLLAGIEHWENASYGVRQASLEAGLRHGVIRTAWTRGLARNSTRRSGQVVSLATDSVERSAAMRASFTGPMIGQMTAPIVVLVAIGFAVGVRQALILAIALPLVPVMVRGFQKIFASVSGRHREASAGLASQFLEALQGLTDLRLLGAGARFGGKLAHKSEELRRRVMSMLAANQVVILVADAGFSLAMLVVAVWLSLSGLASGALTAGPALTLVLLAPLLMEPLNHIGKFFYVGMGGRAATKALRSYTERNDGDSRSDAPVAETVGGSETALSLDEPAVLAQKPAVPAQKREATPSGETKDAPPAIELRAVDFSWGEGHKVLRDVGLSIGQGEHVALTGPSGGGKSTILTLIEGLADPERGAILLNGLELPAAERRRHCSIVRQSAFLFTGTLAENLLLARPDATENELWTALHDANLGEVRRWPEGLQTVIGERGLEISGGQAQRIAIARAFLRDAPILLLDEPTSQVDLSSEQAIREALDRLSRGRTVVTVAHRRALVDAADRVLDVREGEVIA
ncbi:ATP-binding cassette domain-containing protein [Actinomycetaceae bacterium L2_0104]